MFTKYENGAEVEIEEVHRYANGVEQDAEAVYAYKNGAEEEVWSSGKFYITSSYNGYTVNNDDSVTLQLGSVERDYLVLTIPQKIVADAIANNKQLDIYCVDSISYKRASVPVFSGEEQTGVSYVNGGAVTSGMRCQKYMSCADMNHSSVTAADKPGDSADITFRGFGYYDTPTSDLRVIVRDASYDTSDISGSYPYTTPSGEVQYSTFYFYNESTTFQIIYDGKVLRPIG
jgi:hypothetical protein